MRNLAEKLGLGEGLTSTLVWIGTSIALLLFVLVLAVWLVRMLRPSLNVGGSQGRGGRPQRLAITDAFPLDREGRKLVIVRRDNVEHLLLIGGPNDVLVESAIVRTERGARERPRAPGDAELIAAAESALAAELPRSEGAPAAEPQALPHAMPPAPPPMAVPRPATQPPPSISKPQPAQPLDDEFENALAAMQVAQQRQQAPARQAPAAMPSVAMPPPAQPAPRAPAEPAAERFALPPMPAPQPILPPSPVAEAPPAPIPTPMPAPTPEPAAVRQPPMSEMARRLNEVLQKPLSGTLRPPFNKPIPPVPATMPAPKPPEPTAEEPPAPPPPAPLPKSEPPPAARAEPSATPTQPKSTDIEMDLLEEEMARLLGRPQPPSGSGS
ncbi:MAG TPA: hypothetical protein PKW21_01075 [Rhabdaerophilum sp.]|nr:hypothetical protein [Rhabdaerophilum sp.]